MFWMKAAQGQSRCLMKSTYVSVAIMHFLFNTIQWKIVIGKDFHKWDIIVLKKFKQMQIFMQNTNSAISIFDALNALILSSFEFQCK